MKDTNNHGAYQPDQADSKSLHQMIRRLGMHQKTRRIFQEHPSLDAACAMLAGIIGCVFPDAQNPLVGRMLNSAIERVKSMKVSSPELPVEFLIGLVEHANDLCAFRAVAPLGKEEIQWMPLKESWESFASRFDASSIRFMPVNPGDPACEPIPLASIIISRIAEHDVASEVIGRMLKESGMRLKESAEA